MCADREAASLRAGPTETWRLLCLATGTFVISTGAYVMAGLLPAIEAVLKVDAGAVGRLTSAYAVAYAAWAPLGGMLTRRFDRRACLLVGMAAFVAGTAATAWVTSYGGMVAARALTGVAAGTFTPAASAAAAALVSPARQARAIAWIIGGLSAATILAAPVGSIIGNRAGYRPVMLIVTALGVAAGAALCFLPRIPSRWAQETAARAGPVRVNAIAVLLGVSFLVSAADFTVYTYISLLLARLSWHGNADIGWLLFLYGCAGIIGNIAGGQLGDRWGTRRTVLSAIMVLAISTAGMAWHQALPVVALLVVLWGISGWMVVPALQSELMLLHSGAAGILAAANASVIYAGIAVGSLIGGIVISAVSVLALGPCAAGLAVAALVAYVTHCLAGNQREGRTAMTESLTPM